MLSALTPAASGVARTTPNLLLLRTVEQYRRIPVEYLASVLGRHVEDVRRDLERFQAAGVVTIKDGIVQLGDAHRAEAGQPSADG